MTREEQIIEASQLYAKHQQKPFMDGARWADKHPSQDQIDALRMEYEKGRADAIGMACEFLQDRIAHDSISYPMATHHLIEELKNYIKEQQ